MSSFEKPEIKVHEGQPLVPISEDDLADHAQLAHWTLTEALFLLSGNKPPGYESTSHMQDHFLSAYSRVVRAIEMDEICRKTERAGERYFVDSPASWFAWADKQGPEHVQIDDRLRRIFAGKAVGDTPAEGGQHPKLATQRERGKAKTSAKYAGFDKRSRELKKQNSDFKKADLKRLLEKEQSSGQGWVSADTIERALNARHPGWAD